MKGFQRTATRFENAQGGEYDSVTNRERLAAQQAFSFLSLLEMRAYSTLVYVAMALPALKQAKLSPRASIAVARLALGILNHRASRGSLASLQLYE